MKKYILGVISDSDLQDRLAGILKENGWYVPRHTDKELVFLTKGGEKIIFSKINKLNGYISKDDTNPYYSRYNDKGEFLGFISAKLPELVNTQGFFPFGGHGHWSLNPACLNATFKETSIHAVAKDKAYRYDLDFYDNLHVLKNNIALSELIVACNKGFAPSLESLHQGLKSEAVAAFVSSAFVIVGGYVFSDMREFWAQGRPKFDKNGKMSLARYGYGEGFHIDRSSSGGLFAVPWSYDGFAHAFESVLANSVLEPYTRISISLNPRARGFENRPTSPYRDQLNLTNITTRTYVDLEFITGISFSDDELSDNMGSDLLYAPKDNYVKGNTFIYIDEQMLVIQFGEDIVIIGSGDLVTGDDNFAFLGIRNSGAELFNAVLDTGEYFDANGVHYSSGYYYGELIYKTGFGTSASFDDVFSEDSKNPLSGAPLKGRAWGAGTLTTKWVYDKILKTEKHYHANTTIKAGKKTYDFLHSSLGNTYGLLIQVDEVKNV